MKQREYIITAAGGNGTAIEILDRPLTRSAYVVRGKKLGKRNERFGAEQAGFLIPSVNHFEMAGGEFCGNSSRSAAVLLFILSKRQDPSFTVSGYSGTVQARVDRVAKLAYDVTCRFDGLPTEMRPVDLSSGEKAHVVDLGGIVHVVIEQPKPATPAAYETRHREITRELSLENRSAVGVLWITKNPDGVIIHPIVWVKEVDTFFYEQSCGSGTIAVAKVTGISTVRQPTGQSIFAHIQPNTTTLRSEMRVIERPLPKRSSA